MNIQKSISSLQLFIIITNISIGAGLITLPRRVSIIAKEDMWFATLLGGLCMMPAIAFTVKLSEFFPGRTSIEYNRLLLGKICGQILNVLLILQIIAVTAVSLRIFSATCKVFIFDMTPIEVISFSLLAVAAYMGQYGYTPHLRAQQFLFLTATPPFFLIILLGLFAVNLQHYLPFLVEGITPAFRGSVQSWLSFSGGELILGFIYPFLTKRSYALKASLLAIGFSILFTVFLVLIVQGILGAEDTQRQIFPTVIAYREVEIPETFVERIDGYFIIFWIFSYFLSLANCLYFAAFGAGRLLCLEDYRPLIWLLTPLILLISLIPTTIMDVENIINWLNITGVIWGLVLLPGLVILAWFKSKRRCTCE